MNSTSQVPGAGERDETRNDTTERGESSADPTQSSDYQVSNEPNQSARTASRPDQDGYSFSTEQSRTVTSERDKPRPVASEHDVTRNDATGRDEPSKDVPEERAVPDINWLDVEQAAELLKERGISRTIRTIQKMCKREDLVAKLVPTENGVRYIISDRSIDDFVEQHNQKLPSGGFGSELNNEEQSVPREPAMANVVSETPVSSAEDRSDAEAHFKEIVDLKNQHIALLESQLAAANGQMAVKDEQIATMHERDHETNILIQNLQGLVALPQNCSQPPEPTNGGTGTININHRTGPEISQP